MLHPRVRRSYDDERRSALFFAVSNNDLHCVRILLEAGAMVNQDPVNCLQVALRQGNYELINTLLKYGANVNYYSRVNTTHFPTALQYALKDEVMLRMILNNGGREERERHFYNGGGWVKRRVCGKRRRNRQSYKDFTERTVPQNGPEPQGCGKGGLRMRRDRRAALGGRRSRQKISRHFGHSQPKWRSAWMQRRCNARTRSHRTAKKRAGGRPGLQQLSLVGVEIERRAAAEKLPDSEEDERTERWCHVAAILNRACPAFIILTPACR
ncbi:hypothetical protein XENOCAPTIV_016370 [Xenoophorus captivus]|uniref:Uncharacterized protein n=1 Tax=Xenoophorus captivus TaxID=1517983 RepID=A0ABV0RJG9_9TELE